MPYQIIINSGPFKTIFIARFIEEIHAYIDDLNKNCEFLDLPNPQYSIKHIHYEEINKRNYVKV